ncbi:hypothetical protein D3C72_1913350 [compost metagenome]
MAEPTLLLAPGRFSTMMVCFRRGPSFSITMRVTMSVEPPGVYGTMILMGLLGQSSAAWAGPAARPAAARAANNRVLQAWRRSVAAVRRGCDLLACAMDLSPP